MKYTIHVGEYPIELRHEDFDKVINVDDLTKIDTSNLFGEAVTADAAANRIGLLLAELEGQVADLVLERKVLQGKVKERMRAQAANNSGFYIISVDKQDVKVKISEKALETCYETDEDWINKSKEIIKKEKQMNDLKSLYWSMQNKSRKLNSLISGTTPEDFVKEMVDGKINGILIKKK